MLTDRPQKTPPSPIPRATGGFFASIGAALTRTRSASGDRHVGSETSSTVTKVNSRVMTDLQSRSLSRGRDGFTSSGRGGLGNIRQTSSSRTRPESGPDDFSSTRGREHAVDTARVFSFGRGGAGNLRSPSREVSSHVGPDIKEQVVVENFVAAQRDTPHSTGRGGLGNITGRSRSRGPAPGGPALPVHSTGRGGAGNILQGDAVQADVADEVERRKAGAGVLVDEIRSTGRGGAANFTAAPEPAIERPPAVHHPNHPSSTGRGGAGNIVRE